MLKAAGASRAKMLLRDLVAVDGNNFATARGAMFKPAGLSM